MTVSEFREMLADFPDLPVVIIYGPACIDGPDHIEMYEHEGQVVIELTPAPSIREGSQHAIWQSEN